MSFKRERAWINKKINLGVSREELLQSVGMFSNKNKKKVMAQKNLTEEGYKKRYGFLANVYYLLSNTPAKSTAAKRSDTYQRKATSDTKKWVLERYGSYDNFYKAKRETERLKKQEAYDYFYGK